MDRSKVSILTHIYEGYARAFMGVVRLLIFLAAIAMVSFAFTFPLWYWALHFTSSFTLSMILLFSAGILYLLYTKAAGFVLRRRREGVSYFEILRGPLVSIARILLLLVFLYLIATLLGSSQLILAVAVAVVALLTLGVLFFVK
jgi:hypothetical protein